MPPKYPEFKSLELSDRKEIVKHLSACNPQICELALANLYIWQDFDHPKLTLVNDNLCILINPVNEPPFFLEPIGRHKIEATIETCLKETGRLARVSESLLPQLDLNKYHISCGRDHFDYVYENKALAELKGKKYDGKRNHLKNFQHAHPDYEFVILNPDHLKEALELFEVWFATRKESHHFPKLAHSAQQIAITKAFALFTPLNLLGGAIYIDRKLSGFTIGSRLNKNTAAVHFLYAHPALRGVFQTLLWEACNKTFKEFELINLEQDLGIPGLRKAKMSNQPLRLEKKCEVTLKPSALTSVLNQASKQISAGML